MSTIRRQSILSSMMVYFGFALGFFNTYLFTREGGFTPEQYGLTGAFIAIANVMFAVSSFGMPAFINKFYPYYKHWLPVKKNDLMSWALLIPVAGFVVVTIAGIFFKDILIDNVFDNSPQLLEYYYWIFPFGFGFTIFLVLEAFSWQQRKAVLSNFMKEVVFRFFISLLIILSYFGIISSFDIFIKFYSFTYILLAGSLIYFFIKTNRLKFNFQVSNVTHKFRHKILALTGFVWAGGLIFTLSNVFDTIVLAAVLPNGLAIAGIFTLAQNISSLIQAPQRGVISASIGALSTAWKEKDYKKINIIYQRSSINLLIFSTAMFCLIWLNFEDGVRTFNLRPVYLQAQSVFLLLGLTRVIDLGTGVNSQIIATSTYWRFEFLTGVILLALVLPLNYFLTKELGLIGPAIANLIAFTIYNAIRFTFLYRKFNMQPFSIKSLLTIFLAAGCYLVCYFLFGDNFGIQWIIIRSISFIILFATGMFALNLSPDLKPVLATLKRKAGI
jgi:O-antigen/teichoic acid export membrane protein